MQNEQTNVLPPLADLIKQLTQEAYRIVKPLAWHEYDIVPEEVPSAVYAHLLRIYATYPREVAPVVLSKLILFYLRFHLNPRLSFHVTMGLFSADLTHLASYGNEKHLRAITQNALIENKQIILHLTDLSQAAFPLQFSEQIAGYLALSTSVPRFFTPERQQVIMLYTDVFSLAL
jgi:hypothetical protein